MLRSLVLGGLVIVVISGCASPPASPPDRTPPPATVAVPPPPPSTGAPPATAPLVVPTESTVGGASESVPEDLACTADDECTASTFSGCCGCCPCVEVYPTRKDVLAKRETRCHAVRCARGACPDPCPSCRKGEEAVGVACRDGRCQLLH